jgi:hypothetical protein
MTWIAVDWGQNKARCRAVVLGLGIMFLGSPGIASAHEQAEFLWFENCGTYQISKITVQRRSEEGGNWVDTDYAWGKGDAELLYSGRAVCFDIGAMEETREKGGIPNGYQARLKVKIRSGETIFCDSTWINRDDDIGTRKFLMRGETHSNNGCRSQGYKYKMRNKAKCNPTGKAVNAKRC